MFKMSKERAAAIELARKEKDCAFAKAMKTGKYGKHYDRVQLRKKRMHDERMLLLSDRESRLLCEKSVGDECEVSARVNKALGGQEAIYNAYERRCEIAANKLPESRREMFEAGKGVRMRKRCKVGSEISMRRPSAANSLSLNGRKAEFNSFRRGEKSHARALMRRANEKQRMY